MSRYDASVPRPRKQVRFAPLPPSYTKTKNQAEVKLPAEFTPWNDQQPAPVRYHSMPEMNMLRSHGVRMRALEALNDLRSYLTQACNFHGQHLRSALSVPSVDALSALIAFVNALRKDVDNRVTDREERRLRSLIDARKRHPHEQLADFDPSDDLVFPNRHERWARVAHRKRLRREAEHHLLNFVSRQLRMSQSALRKMTPDSRAQCELDAFKDRIRKFNVPTSLTTSPGTHSAPQSPAQRVGTGSRSPSSVPNSGRRDPFEFPSLRDALNDMEEISLPGSSFDVSYDKAALRRRPSAPANPTSRPGQVSGHNASSPAQFAHLHSDSPYIGVPHSPYISAPQASPLPDTFISSGNYDPRTIASPMSTFPDVNTMAPGHLHSRRPTQPFQQHHPMPSPQSPYTGPTLYGTAAPPPKLSRPTGQPPFPHGTPPIVNYSQTHEMLHTPSPSITQSVGGYPHMPPPPPPPLPPQSHDVPPQLPSDAAPIRPNRHGSLEKKLAQTVHPPYSAPGQY